MLKIVSFLFFFANWVAFAKNENAVNNASHKQKIETLQ